MGRGGQGRGRKGPKGRGRKGVRGKWRGDGINIAWLNL